MPRLMATTSKCAPQNKRSLTDSELNRRFRFRIGGNSSSAAVTFVFEAFEASVDSFKNDRVAFDDLSSVLDHPSKTLDILSSFGFMLFLQRDHVSSCRLNEEPTNPKYQCEKTDIERLDRPRAHALDAFERLLDHLG